jgi:hypothetical protein
MALKDQTVDLARKASFGLAGGVLLSRMTRRGQNGGGSSMTSSNIGLFTPISDVAQ